MYKNYRTVQEFLESYADAKAERDRLDDDIALLTAKATSITPKSGGDPGGGGTSDPHKDSMLIAYAEQRPKLCSARDVQAGKMTAVKRFISSMPGVYAPLLKLRYMDGEKMNAIPEKLALAGFSFSERHVYRLHKEALQFAERVWPGRTQQ